MRKVIIHSFIFFFLCALCSAQEREGYSYGGHPKFRALWEVFGTKGQNYEGMKTTMKKSRASIVQPRYPATTACHRSLEGGAASGWNLVSRVCDKCEVLGTIAISYLNWVAHDSFSNRTASPKTVPNR